MLPESTKSWLSEFDYPEYTETVRSNEKETKAHLSEVGVDLESDLAEFYLKFGALSGSGWYELLEPRELKEMSDYLHSEFEIPKRYMPLTGYEGGGFSLLDRDSGFVYDLVFDQIDDLAAGTLGPVAKSFGEYLEWRKDQHN